MDNRPKLSRRQRLAGKLSTFVQQYARKAYPGMDPNDRRYDRNIEKKVRKMDPEELDYLLREDDEQQ